MERCLAEERGPRGCFRRVTWRCLVPISLPPRLYLIFVSHHLGLPFAFVHELISIELRQIYCSPEAKTNFWMCPHYIHHWQRALQGISLIPFMSLLLNTWSMGLIFYDQDVFINTNRLLLLFSLTLWSRQTFLFCSYKEVALFCPWCLCSRLTPHQSLLVLNMSTSNPVFPIVISAYFPLLLPTQQWMLFFPMLQKYNYKYDFSTIELAELS